MATLPLRLELPPTELLLRLPRRAGTFLLDGGAPDSWGSGEALLGSEAAAVIAFRRPPGEGEDPFAVLDDATRAHPGAGVVCALGYDLGRWVERLGPGPADEMGLPQLFAAAHRWVLAYSYAEDRYELRAPAMPDEELRRVAARLQAAAAGGGRAVARPAARLAPGAVARLPCNVTSSFSREGYREAVRRVLAYIGAGDVYQVNLAQRFRAPRSEPPQSLFARLLARHPAPYAAYVDGGPWALVSNSPECLLQRSSERVATFPIKGTRPRAEQPARDKAMASALLSSIKDGAEHLMIVDLERNDLGRVCRYGSVRVAELARLRSFASVHHLESEVAGELAPHTPLAALLRAVFPGGSITGAPKVRAMQIIDELEPVGRGFYTGAIGFIDAAGGARLNVAIRTATVTAEAATYHAGGGVVADSDPDEEYRETLLKARAFFDALAVASR
jgi:para-aminobenzoate synthetase component 1